MSVITCVDDYMCRWLHIWWLHIWWLHELYIYISIIAWIDKIYELYELMTTRIDDYMNWYNIWIT